MASDGDGNGNSNYMECILIIDTSDGWEKSVTKVLTSFKDLTYEINPNVGFIYVKGVTDPQIILLKLKKAGKHASIHWISYGFPKDDQNYVHDPENYLNFLNGHGHFNYHDPFYQAIRDPYDTYNRFYNPYYSWYNNTEQLAQNGLHQRQLGLEHEHSSGTSERRTSSSSSHSHNHHHHHCPMHLRHSHSSLSSSQSHRTPDHNSSPPSVRPEAANNDQARNYQSAQPEVNNDQARNQSVPEQSFGKSIKKIFGKLRLFCSKI